MGLQNISPARRQRLRGHALPVLLVIAGVAFLIGLISGAGATSEAEDSARSFIRAWEKRDYEAMYRELTPAARKRTDLAAFTRAYEDAAKTATATRLDARDVKGSGDGARAEIVVETRVFGRVRQPMDVRATDEGVSWKPEMAFPGLRSGERLTRKTQAPPRAKILDRRGHTIASGPADARVANPDHPAASVVGEVGPPKEEADIAAAYERGFPVDAPVGTSGLERALEPQLAGTPGGDLLAGSRRLASSEPKPAKPVRSSIDPKVQAAAVQALAGRFGGIAAVQPHTGRIRALAGIAFSSPQPPGSTFKIVTATAALEHRLVKPSTKFPVETHAVIDGVNLENASGESCGGSFANSFAESCNSVFAPLGVKLGAKRLVDAAEDFGFNEEPAVDGAATSTIPAAGEVGGPLAVGSTAIGQGEVLATPLQMAVIADTIASGGVRHEVTLLEDGPDTDTVRVTSKRIARIVERLMIEVVEHGTGTAASLGSVKVAGKTGTAELSSTAGPAAADPNATPLETDAWFAAFAPARRPKLSVGVLFVEAGAGGDVAAPAAKTVLQAALGR